MKQYPSIQNIVQSNASVIIQPKYDGNNIRAEWNKKKGFYKFGTRKQLIDKNTNIYGISIPIIQNKYEENLSRVFINNRWENVVCFFELFGPNSFAGRHAPADKLDVILFDANVFKIGILEPKEFVKTFSSVEIPETLYKGQLNQQIVEEIKFGTFLGATFEGVVCKGKGKHKGQPLMFKIKTRAWIEKVKIYCGNDEKKLMELL